MRKSIRTNVQMYTIGMHTFTHFMTFPLKAVSIRILSYCACSHCIHEDMGGLSGLPSSSGCARPL
jgi:hypothetical protein